MSLSPFPIGNTNNPPLNGVDGRYVNVDNSHVGEIATTSTVYPNGPHTLPATGSNVQSAAGIYPGSQKGGKINRKKINKISRKYKMKGSKRTIRRNVKRIKSRMRSKYSRRHSRKYSNRSSRRRHMKGGNFLPPMVTPNYPAGHTQYLLNNGSQSNVYSLGGLLPAANSALANPPLLNKLVDATRPDNAKHDTLNAYGNIGSGSGFPSRGWF